MMMQKISAPNAIEAQGIAKDHTTIVQACSGVGKYSTDKYGDEYKLITFKDICTMAQYPQEVEKSESAWAIPSTLKSREFQKQEKEGRYVWCWMDFDLDPAPLEVLASAINKKTMATALHYTSRSARIDKQKSRLIMPLSAIVDYSCWRLYQQGFADWLEGQGFIPDRKAVLRAAQLCYLPNRGEYYQSILYEGALLNPAIVFAGEIEEIKKAEQQAEEEAQERMKQAALRRVEFKASGRESIIDWFNSCYSVEGVLLSAGYCQRGRHFRHPASESGGFSASVKDGRVFALSSADPLWSGSQGAHDPFSAFAAIFFNGNQSAAASHAWAVAKGGNHG